MKQSEFSAIQALTRTSTKSPRKTLAFSFTPIYLVLYVGQLQRFHRSWAPDRSTLESAVSPGLAWRLHKNRSFRLKRRQPRRQFTCQTHIKFFPPSTKHPLVTHAIAYLEFLLAASRDRSLDLSRPGSQLPWSQSASMSFGVQ